LNKNQGEKENEIEQKQKKFQKYKDYKEHIDWKVPCSLNEDCVRATLKQGEGKVCNKSAGYCVTQAHKKMCNTWGSKIPGGWKKTKGTIRCREAFGPEAACSKTWGICYFGKGCVPRKGKKV
jgi:hypothetical protein